MDLIDRSKIDFHKLTLPELVSAMEKAPSVPAVPLEPLAKWIVENLDPSIDCRTCAESPRSYECACLPCPPMSEKQVKEALKKWMEGQDAPEKDS